MRRNTSPALFTDVFETEYKRVYSVLRDLPELLLSNSPITAKDLENIGLTGVDIYVGKWEQVIETLNAAIKLRNEYDLVIKQLESLRESIYSAVETSLRPVRDLRITDQ